MNDKLKRSFKAHVAVGKRTLANVVLADLYAYRKRQNRSRLAVPLVVLACAALSACSTRPPSEPETQPLDSLPGLVDPITEIDSLLSEASRAVVANDAKTAKIKIDSAVEAARLLEEPSLLVEVLSVAASSFPSEEAWDEYRLALLQEAYSVSFEYRADIHIEARSNVTRELADLLLEHHLNLQALLVLRPLAHEFADTGDHNNASLLIAEMATLALDESSVEGFDEATAFNYWDEACSQACFADESIAIEVFDAAVAFAELHLPEAIPLLRKQRFLALGSGGEAGVADPEYLDAEDMLAEITQLESSYNQARRYAESLHDANADTQRLALRRSGNLAAQKMPVFPGDFAQPELEAAAFSASQEAEALLLQLNSARDRFKQHFHASPEDYSH